MASISATKKFSLKGAIKVAVTSVAIMVEVLGNKGRHARSTIGVAELPADAAVEVEAMFEIA